MFAAELRDLVGRVADIAAAPGAASDRELSECVRDLERLDAGVARLRAAVLAEWDQREVWRNDGALTGATWIAHRGETPRAAAAADLRVARRLRHMPATTAALKTGQLGAAKVRLLANARRDDVTEAFDRDEERLVEWCRPLTVDQTAQLLRHWADAARPDGTAPQDLRDRCELFVSQTLDGTHIIKGRLDPEWGAALARALHAKARELREQTADGEVERPASWWRAAGLNELVAEAGATEAAKGRPPRASVIAVVDASVLAAPAGSAAPFGSICEIDTAGRVLGETARRLACDAMLTEAVLGPDNALLNLGRTYRTATDAQRKALLVRDQCCTFPGCDRPATWCQAHHIIWWEDDGPTDLDNLALLCSKHHHLVHEGGWRLTRAPNNQLEFRRPDGTVLTSDRPNHLPLRYPNAPPGQQAA